MKWLFGILCVALGVAGLMPGTAAAQDTSAPISDPVLNPGDRLRLVVWRNAEMSGEFEIMPDSTLGHPILREVKVGGAPLSVAEQRLRVFLGRFESNPYIVLLPQYRVFVGGEGVNPTVHTFSPNVSIAEAVLLAGGTPETVRMDRVRLVRDGQEQVLDLSSMDSRDATRLVRSGDQILLKERRHLLRDYFMPTLRFLGAVTAILNFARRL